MKTLQISAKLEGGEPVTVDFEMPENLAEMVEAWSEEAVYNQARQAVVVSLQGRMRNMIKPTRKEGIATDEELQEMADNFEVGTRKPAKSKAEKIKEQYASLDPELKKQLLEEMRRNQDQPAQKPAPKQNGAPAAAKTAAKSPTGAKQPTGQRPPQQATRPAQQAPAGAKRPAQAPQRGPARR